MEAPGHVPRVPSPKSGTGYICFHLIHVILVHRSVNSRTDIVHKSNCPLWMIFAYILI